jgi:hypothetical protein
MRVFLAIPGASDVPCSAPRWQALVAAEAPTRAMPGFATRLGTLSGAIDVVALKVRDLIGIDAGLARCWGRGAA